MAKPDYSQEPLVKMSDSLVKGFVLPMLAKTVAAALAVGLVIGLVVAAVVSNS